MFCTNNIREKVDFNKNIIDTKDNLDDNIAGDNNNSATDQKSADIELQNNEENTEIFFEKLFANAYKNNKLVQAIIDAKVRNMRKLPCKILKQVKLSIGDLEVKNSRLYVQSNIYILDDKNLRLYLLWQQHNFFDQRYFSYKIMF